jgi:DNA topoisomerase-1
VFGKEKNRLLITHTGIIVMEFLLKHFGDLVEYSYTETMEESLDEIVAGRIRGEDLCKTLADDITRYISSMDKKKEEIDVDDNHKLIIGKTGSVIVSKEGVFTRVKKDIDLDKLKKGEYRMEEITEKADASFKGEFMGEEIHVKSGRYGVYATWKGNNISLAAFKKVPMEKISLENVIWAIRKKMEI